MSPGRSLPIRMASLGSTIGRTTYPRGSRAPRTHGPIVRSSSTTRIVGARGSDDCAEGEVLTEDGSCARKLFLSPFMFGFTCQVLTLRIIRRPKWSPVISATAKPVTKSVTFWIVCLGRRWRTLLDSAQPVRRAPAWTRPACPKPRMAPDS